MGKVFNFDRKRSEHSEKKPRDRRKFFLRIMALFGALLMIATFLVSLIVYML